MYKEGKIVDVETFAYFTQCDHIENNKQPARAINPVPTTKKIVVDMSLFRHKTESSCLPCLGANKPRDCWNW